ncbi:hypothetical protein PAXRUDRAFT_145485 [Paxillus rubicundulus Ve08.2h10]|uniref:Uncharacterized protein n=1 Tax=Paxillus rubicundulus Ve08.2h10 TaxID=930991 RepID=A0A0D0E6C2_9AGAM|nr:hypothetical protein PAXRUDRAFT_145485 [Paxillus rubicundulus Ve08.2h10]
MLSNTASADTPTCLTLIGPSNFQIWKLQIITAKLWREKVLGVALGTDTCPITSLSIPVEEVWKWMEQNERAHGIIQDNISNALLLKMEMHTTAMETGITLEEAHLNPSGSLDSTLKVSNKSSACPPNSATWCEHHQQSRHSSDDCYAYQCWTKEL